MSLTHTPLRQAAPTSRELCLRALRVYEHLCRLIDCDEPDLGANVTFTRGRVLLLRLAATESWSVDPDDGAALLAYLDTAERVSDPRIADAWFFSFAEEVLHRLERRGPADVSGARP